MMKCCVSGCKKNDSWSISKSQGITFHTFPTDPEQRKSWLRALNKEGWVPKDRSAVCSQHFHTEDLYVTRNGLWKVRVGATPIMMQGSPVTIMQQNTQICRVCLSTDRKMYPIRKYGLNQAYETLTGLEITKADNLPQVMCFECAHRLSNCAKFRDKSIKTHHILLDIVTTYHQINKQYLQSTTASCTTLNLKYFQPNHCDLNLEDYSEIKHNNAQEYNNENNINTYDIQVDVEIKRENETSNEIFLNEHTENIEKISSNDDIKDNDENSIADDNFHLSDKDFSSDDSIPLQIQIKKTKKKTIKKLSENKLKNIKLDVKKPVKKKIAKNDTSENEAKNGKQDAKKPVKKKIAKNDPNVPKIDGRRKPFVDDELNESLFTIINLSFDEQIAEIEKRQESSNYKNSAFKCTECYKGFLDEDAYATHMSRHTNQCGDHKCDICKTHFRHQHALRKHITAHHSQRFSCNQCLYVTTHRQTARLHEKWHKGTKYQCPHCPEVFTKFTTYMGHIRIKHPSDFVCEMCGYSFISEKGIDLHKKLKHRTLDGEIPVDGPLCEPCNIRFFSSDAYQQHLRVSARHNLNDNEPRDKNKRKQRKWKPSKESTRDVGKDKQDESKQLYPSQIRKAEGPIPCEQCGLQLSDSRAYHCHFRRAHPDKNRTNYPSMKSPCMCEFCGKMFQSYALLKDHTWVHTGEQPFSCDSCGKRFRMKQRLVTHRRVHSQVKATYGCNLCGKHFSTCSNRQRHMSIHTGLRPFKCEMCGKSFKHMSEKRAHVTYVHLKKPWPKRTRGKRKADSRQSMVQQGASEMDINPAVWASCEKDNNMPANVMDKNMYYNLKM